MAYQSSLSAKRPLYADVEPQQQLRAPQFGTTEVSAPAKKRRSTKPRPGREHFRKGKWSVEEEEFTTRIIHHFSTGLLTLPEGLTLRAYLAMKLNCDPMRITKKYAGASCLGKRVYHLCERSPNTNADMERAKIELCHLERVFRARVENTSGSSYYVEDVSNLKYNSGVVIPPHYSAPTHSAPNQFNNTHSPTHPTSQIPMQHPNPYARQVQHHMNPHNPLMHQFHPMAQMVQFPPRSRYQQHQQHPHTHQTLPPHPHSPHTAPGTPNSTSSSSLPSRVHSKEEKDMGSVLLGFMSAVRTFHQNQPQKTFTHPPSAVGTTDEESNDSGASSNDSPSDDTHSINSSSSSSTLTPTANRLTDASTFTSSNVALHTTRMDKEFADSNAPKQEDGV